jgi:hypothetical protein
MKMSGVFELPVMPASSETEGTKEFPPSTEYHIVDAGYYDMAHNENQASAAAHAINNFDGLVEALDDALKLLIKTFDDQKSDYYESSITLSDLGKIHDALTAAKGETK